MHGISVSVVLYYLVSNLANFACLVELMHKQGFPGLRGENGLLERYRRFR